MKEIRSIIYILLIMAAYIVMPNGPWWREILAVLLVTAADHVWEYLSKRIN